jgi:hypothetical protein
MSYLFRLVLATVPVALVSSVSFLHAAPVCSSIVAKQRPPVTALEAQRSGAVLVAQAQGCAQDCEVAGLEPAEQRAALPAPTHLPVVSSPEEVAAWHVEIFEQLADARARPQPTQYCKLDL